VKDTLKLLFFVTSGEELELRNKKRVNLLLVTENVIGGLALYEDSFKEPV
jgi:hypothetical protein